MTTRKTEGFVSLYVLAAVAVVCLICLAIIARNWSCRRPRPPRPPRPPHIVTAGPFEVVSVESGASLTVKTSRRRTSIVQLDGIDLPPAGKWADEARKHLEQQAGGSITVKYEKHGLFRGENASGDESLPVAEPSAAEGPETPVGVNGGSFYSPTTEESATRMGWTEVDCDACKGTGKTLDVKELACPLCGGGGCENCKGSGKVTLDYFTIARCQIWMSMHVDRDKCPVCSGPDICKAAHEKIKLILATASHDPPQMVTCFACEGAGKLMAEPLKARGPIIGEVFGQSGAILNLEQVRAGLATCREGAPNAWTVEQFKAQQEKRGLWSEAKK